MVTESIEGIRPTGIRTEGGRLHEVDGIIFTTGFVVGDHADR
jgi:cation diffusion facilitator CzcD-associated flavoprotein CzcO